MPHAPSGSNRNRWMGRRAGRQAGRLITLVDGLLLRIDVLRGVTVQDFCYKDSLLQLAYIQKCVKNLADQGIT
jgi:hypothetical protein